MINVYSIQRKLRKPAMQAEPQLGLVYLRDCYPTLYVFVLEHFKMQDKAEEYMSECKKYENEA